MLRPEHAHLYRMQISQHTLCMCVFALVDERGGQIALRCKPFETLRRVVRDPSFAPATPSDVAHALLHTCYMGTANSSSATRARAAALAGQVGAYHSFAAIDAAVAAVLWVFAAFASGGLPLLRGVRHSTAAA